MFARLRKLPASIGAISQHLGARFLAVDVGTGAYVNKAQLKGMVGKDGLREALQHDLSKHAVPINAPFPPSRALLERARLSPQQIESFWRDGFVSGIPVLSAAECDTLLAELARLADSDNPHPAHSLFHEFHANQSGNPDAVLLHALGHWRIMPGYHDLIFNPAITVPCSQLLQPGPGHTSLRFWHDQLFAKPAHHGGNVAWHQDYSYWTRTVPQGHLTVHIALDDQDEENGGITYIPGSHRWQRGGMPLPITADDFGNMDSIRAVLTPEENAQFKPLCVRLRRGHAVVHHALSVHGSFANRSARPRRAAVVNYFADGTTSATTSALLDGVPVFPPGAKLQGQFFPLVFDKQWLA
eukprot:m.233756 g.233756  ORF g.233756 m.233756 type:complete len:355 (+) comp19290_c0_seq1:29-1093(+)